MNTRETRILINIIVVTTAIFLIGLASVLGWTYGKESGINHATEQCRLLYENETPVPETIESVEKCLDYYAKRYGYYMALKADNSYECHFVYSKPYDTFEQIGSKANVEFSYKINEVLTGFKSYLNATNQHAVVEFDFTQDLSSLVITADITIMKMY